MWLCCACFKIERFQDTRSVSNREKEVREFEGPGAEARLVITVALLQVVLALEDVSLFDHMEQDGKYQFAKEKRTLTNMHCSYSKVVQL